MKKNTLPLSLSLSLLPPLQSNPLKSPAFEQILGFPVPQQNSHLGKPWFHEKLTRQQSEDMLKRVRMDGAFLIRHSDHRSQGKKNYAISFRCVCVSVCQCVCVCVCVKCSLPSCGQN